MKLNSILILLCSVVMFSCKPKEEGHLSQDKMERVITDLQIAEVNSMIMSDSTHQARNKNYDSLAVYYKDVLHHHNLTLEEFSKSLEWYKNNPDELDTVYAHVITDLSIMSGETDRK